MQAVFDLSELAFEVAAGLQRYQLLLEDMAAAGCDPERCHLATREVEAIAASAIDLPQVTISVVQLSLHHLELLRAVCLRAAGKPSPPSMSGLLEVQIEAVQAMRERCLSLITRH